MITHTLTFDSIVTAIGVDGWVFDADPETWIIAPGVVVFSESKYGVDSGSFANNTLINHGRIYAAGQFAGVHLNLGNGTVVNTAGAEIFGARNGVDLLGNGSQTVTNFGTIVAGDNNGVFFGNDTLGVSITNHGYIFGAAFGVENASKHVSGTINNFGTIVAGSITTVDESDPAAVSLYTLPTLVTNIFNAPGAILKGAINSIYANTGRFHLVNDGTIIGNILDFDNGNDVIINHGKIKGGIYLEGNSTFNGTGGTSGAIYAGDGNDRIIGGNGTVQIHLQGTGNDILTAGPGHDKFFFEFTPVVGQVETIKKFNPALDRIFLSETTDFQNIGPHGPLQAAHFHVGHPMNANPQIDYTPGNGFLYYDANGNAGPQIHFATLFETPTTHPTLTHFDLMVEA